MSRSLPKNTIRSWRMNFGSYIMIWIMSHVQIWKLEREEGWSPKNWCFWTVVLEKTLESPLGSKEIKLVNPKGSRPWIFTGRTDAEAEATILWLPDKVLTHWKRPWCWESVREGEGGEGGWDGWMASPTQWNEFEQTLKGGKGQGSLVCYSSWGHKKLDVT